MIRHALAAFAVASASLTAMAVPALAAPAATATFCGPTIRSIVRTGTPDLETFSSTFIPLAGASVTVQVPAGRSECLKVLVTMSASCGDGKNVTFGEQCRLRVLDNSAQFMPALPPWDGVIIQSSTEYPAGQAMEFVRRVGPGKHVIAVQVRTFAPTIDFEINVWTMDVTVTN